MSSRIQLVCRGRRGWRCVRCGRGIRHRAEEEDDELALEVVGDVSRRLHETYDVGGDGELDVVFLPDAPCVALQSLGVSGLAEQVLLDLEPVTAAIVALD
jgi:hypothetical protein